MSLLSDLKDFIPLMPFMMMTERRAKNGSMISITRLVEAFVIAGISGAIAVYGTTVKLNSELDNLNRNQVRIEMDLKEIKEFAKQTRETQLKMVEARGVRLDAIEKRLDAIDRKIK